MTIPTDQISVARLVVEARDIESECDCLVGVPDDERDVWGCPLERALRPWAHLVDGDLLVAAKEASDDCS